MSRTPAKNTQADIARALRAAKALGMTIEIMPNGTIKVIPCNQDDMPKEPPKVAISVSSLL
jgi:hypothetical protein